MPEKTEIFLVGYYGFQNTGDEAILSSILSDLRQACSGACFTVISHDPPATAARHGIRAIPWFEPHAMAEATDNADLVIIGGGGLFHDASGFAPDALFTKQSWGLGMYSAAALYGSLAGKKVMLYGVGIGPFRSSLAAEYTKAACLAADVVTVRDGLSRDLLESAGVPRSKVILTADCAFASRPCAKGTDLPPGLLPKRAVSGPTVAVVVREWSVDVEPARWEERLARALDGFVQSEGGRLVFVPFQTLESERENDLAVARRIASQLNPQSDVAVVEERMGPEEVKALIASCDLVVGMRLHSVVFAAQAGVPIVALSYDPKVSALMKRLGLPEFDVPVGDIQPRRLRELMTRALGELEIPASLQAASGDLAQQAHRNAELARELLEQPLERGSSPHEVVSIVARAIRGQIDAAKQMDVQLAARQGQVEEFSTLTRAQHADNERLIGQIDERRGQVEELSACIQKQHADNERLTAQLKQRQDRLEEFSASVGKQRAENEELTAQINQQREQVDELSACVEKQHADNEELIRQLEQRREQVEELSVCIRRQHTDNEELISAASQQSGQLAELKQQLQGKDRAALQLEQRHASEIQELDTRLQELTQDHTQALELSASLQQELETARESHQQLTLAINRRLSVRLRRSLHKLLDISQARTPEPLRRALRGLYLPVYRLLFPGGKDEFETLDRVGSSNVRLKEDQRRPGGAA